MGDIRDEAAMSEPSEKDLEMARALASHPTERNVERIARALAAVREEAIVVLCRDAHGLGCFCGVHVTVIDGPPERPIVPTLKERIDAARERNREEGGREGMEAARDIAHGLAAHYADEASRNREEGSIASAIRSETLSDAISEVEQAIRARIAERTERG